MYIEDAVKINFDLLDMIDLSDFIEPGIDPRDIMDDVQENYEEGNYSDEINEIIDGEVLQGNVFNYISVEDFMNYLTEKYNITFTEELRYYISL